MSPCSAHVPDQARADGLPARGDREPDRRDLQQTAPETRGRREAAQTVSTILPPVILVLGLL